MNQEIIERCTIAQALYKSIAPFVKTGDPDNLRGQMDAEYRKIFEETGARSFEVNINDIKVGTYTFAAKKPKTNMRLYWDDDDELLEWAIEHGCVEVVESKVIDHILETGEVPPHAGIDEWTTPPSYTPTFKIDVESVKEALGTSLPAAINGLLEESNE